MPYIAANRRDDLKYPHPMSRPWTVGELNFYVTSTILDFLGSFPGYADYNAVIGVLECVKLELYRMAIAPYENRKAEENGAIEWP